MEDDVIDIDDEPIESENSSTPTQIDTIILEEQNNGDLSEVTEQILEEDIKQHDISETNVDEEIMEQEDIVESDDDKNLVVTKRKESK